MEISSGLIIAAVIGLITGIIIISFINKNKSLGLLVMQKKKLKKLSNQQMKKVRL
jgi:hypothetical protein